MSWQMIVLLVVSVIGAAAMLVLIGLALKEIRALNRKEKDATP